MTTEMEPEITKRKIRAMAQWAVVLTRSAQDAVERMDTTLTLAEAKVALVRELIALRHAELPGE
jgi:hypothetical protein